ncbi:hypothetical protein HYDPIDRAFT_169641 [Hydnomerulius pinastri MD-312]|uniref:XPG N-terminal domain-containing protein n=1 Tax=Hydnomerulius pinastri MD-312 TaxID=994086 RepID=A0A0C9V7K7_9AGAM|nr:hypothetical protein HYDPIDRAFT_169641 [Hydnomerulius pinastri MD-312]
MGVLGLTPFLQKAYPEVIKRLPDRLKSLRGKTIVMHVLGWHRIIAELKECDVRAICVFDGKERNAAKARENERRRETRKIDAARGSIETNRLHRLQKLIRLLPHYRSLRTSDRQRVTETLGKASPAKRPLSSYPTRSSSRSTPATDRVYPPGRHPYFFAHGGMGVDELQEVMESISLRPTPDPLLKLDHSATEPDPPPPDHQNASTDSSVYTPPEDLHDADPCAALPTASWSAAVQDQGPSLPWSRDPAPPTTTADPTVPDSIESFEAELSALYHEYRQSPPTAFEAEALAAALVLHGHADYVASEDTDVLVYEAPLLRNITAREAPLVLVAGDAVRATLGLERESYVDLALLMGTDFSQRIKNVGPARALKFIREHGSIERVIAHESKYPPRVPVPDYLEEVGLARTVFQTLPPVPDPESLRQTEGDPGAVAEIVQRCGLQKVLWGSWDHQLALAGNYFNDNPAV